VEDLNANFVHQYGSRRLEERIVFARELERFDFLDDARVLQTQRVLEYLSNTTRNVTINNEYLLRATLVGNPDVDLVHFNPGDRFVGSTDIHTVTARVRKERDPNSDAIIDESFRLVMPAFRSFVPLNAATISAAQISDFRAQNELRRAKFQIAADGLIKSFGEATTEEDAQRTLRLVGQELREQQEKLETIYRHTRIEAAAKMVGTIGGPPALLGVIGSVLGISCVEAAGFVASAALSVVPWLIAREKADMAVNESPWAYLWHMKRELR